MDAETRFSQRTDPSPEATPADGRPAPKKADLGKRAVAVIIDGVIAVAVGMVPVIGGLAATAYWLVRDGLEVDFMSHRSLGKKVMNLRPVTLDGAPLDLATSAMRNWPLAVGGLAQLLLSIPFVGWLLVIPVGLAAAALGLIEVVLVLTDGQGRRLGDKMAGTKVIDG